MVGAGVFAFAGSVIFARLTDQPLGLVVACGLLCFTGAIASLFVTLTMSRASNDGIVGGAIAGMLVRAAMAMAGAIVFVSAGLGQRQVVGGWILYWYLTFLVVEVVWLVRQMSPTSSTQEAQSC
ncbi:hypothetical protein Poly24_42790 [Rosistilla carotiformis]|uniref:Uncharacterized protein n=2 Tax=Rosistilla carotiformis TaxID=2528017 RepID=A0A518JYE2_9BACT|nr:hypothetical protein Poly24_42790 [Rosistilla carotiformis]